MLILIPNAMCQATRSHVIDLSMLALPRRGRSTRYSASLLPQNIGIILHLIKMSTEIPKTTETSPQFADSENYDLYRSSSSSFSSSSSSPQSPAHIPIRHRELVRSVEGYFYEDAIENYDLHQGDDYFGSPILYGEHDVDKYWWYNTRPLTYEIFVELYLGKPVKEPVMDYFHLFLAFELAEYVHFSTCLWNS